jgi:pimeloyl-ACP methyl ester carboxylesterase/DNA-binding CsgD family transcriptional regulator
MSSPRQKIRFTTARDQTRLAWASSGAGQPLVKASNWITHLEYDWESPVWSHWIQFFSEHFLFIRSDERGNGLSQHQAELSVDNWLGDLEDVVEAASPSPPFALLGISQGSIAAIQYAVKYPERVSHLILYGGYSRGWSVRSSPELKRQMRAMIELTELCWGKPEPTYRRVYSSRFLPEGTEEQLQWFDELIRTTTLPEMAARQVDYRGLADVDDLLSSISVPTLVLHANRDQCVPIESGMELASNIPGAEFVQLDSPNHILLETEPAWERLKEAVLEFTGVKSAAEAEIFLSLSTREREILTHIVDGLTNIEIGGALFISEKTVRNHITRIFSKLEVRTRTQAMVFARENGFRI